MPVIVAVIGAPADRWLVAFTAAVLVVLVGGWCARLASRAGGSGDESHHAPVRGVRRRAGALLAVGPLAGVLVAPGAGDHVAVAAIGALGLAGLGLVVELRRDADRLVALVVAGFALGAVVAGVRFAPTGVGALDAVFAFGIVLIVTLGVDGLGNVDSLVSAVGAAAALGLVALGVLGEQLGIADGGAGILGATVAFLAYHVSPASLFPGRAGRLALGYALAVLALSTDATRGGLTDLVVPLLLTAVPLVDALVVVFDRARRRRPVLVDRRDHLTHRLMLRGASSAEGVTLLVAVQAALVVLAVFLGRGVLSVWLVLPVVLVGVGTLVGDALRSPVEVMAPVGLSRRARGIVAAAGVLGAVGVVPLVLAVPSIAETMQDARRAAQRGLAAARRGDAARAEIEFRRARGIFQQADDDLHSWRFEAARVVPGVAPNLRAARALADVGTDLAHNGEVVTAAVVPESLAIVDGRLPLEEVVRITPALERGADTLERALARLRAVRDEPYLLAPLRAAVTSVRRELRRAAREARNTATAARLAPAIFGGDGEVRRYLLVVQNPAENRGTGGLIGAYGILTVHDGGVQMGELSRAGAWNDAVRTAGAPTYEAPDDYVRRYGQFRPDVNLQSVNLSPDFPTVGRVLRSLAPAAGLGEVDGVIAVDPFGLAALLELTGPVDVEGWPVPITADNVLDVTLRDAYAAFARTPERADFLGDVAQVVVGEAVAGRLGEPAVVARVLGEAAHQGHLVLWFARPEEQRLAERLGVAGAMVRGPDLLHVTDANLAANKLDYYLERELDYRVVIHPDADGRGARARAALTIRLANTAPITGLPRVVAGPYEGAPPGRFRAGENVTYVSVYSPLDVTGARLDGEPVAVTSGDELGTRVHSTIVELDAQETRVLQLDLSGRVRMGGEGWYGLALGRQPSVHDDRVRVSVSVPEGYRIAAVRRLQKAYARRASGIVILDRPTSVWVRVERAPSSLWDRLRAGN